MDQDRLFDSKLIELARVAALPEIDEYQMLSASAALRLLLLDDTPLMHQVNRARRLKIRFEVCSEETPLAKMQLELIPVFWAPLDGLSPALGPPCIVESLTLDKFLRSRAAIVQGHDVTVKDVILQIAHVAGGVHAGTPKTEIEKVLHEQSKLMFLGGMPAVERMIKGIAAVTVDALIPLGEQIRSEGKGVRPGT